MRWYSCAALFRLHNSNVCYRMGHREEWENRNISHWVNDTGKIYSVVSCKIHVFSCMETIKQNTDCNVARCQIDNDNVYLNGTRINSVVFHGNNYNSSSMNVRSFLLYDSCGRCLRRVFLANVLGNNVIRPA